MSTRSDTTEEVPLDHIAMPTRARSKRSSSKTKQQSSAKRAKTTVSLGPDKNGDCVDSFTKSPLEKPETHSSPSPLSESTLPNIQSAENSNSSTTTQGSSASKVNKTATFNAPEPHTPPPALANTHPDFTDVNYIPYDQLVRATNFAFKSDMANTRFSVSKIPADARWGTTTATDHIYCHDGRPITYWLVGVVVSKWFTNLKGEPQLRVNIGLRLPYRDNDSLAKNIYKLASPPRKDEDIPDLVFAGKYTGRQVRGSADAVPQPFKDVYDAQHRFRAKREMCIIPPAYISKNDLVLVEAFLTRWNTAKDKKGKSQWKFWDVNFELQAISLLFEAPCAVDENDYGPANNIRDDM